MWIQLVGNPVLVNTDVATPYVVKAGQTFALPVISNQFGGTLTSGNMGGFNAAAGKSRIYWRNNATGGEVQIWQLANDAALDTFLTTFRTEIAAATPAFVLLANGTKQP